ncbi:NAD synthetase [Merismopedia glauca CCAP 1448/3]|uniref:NAD synthetase n=1 Tax=Merismopedia glauca CCAP 1448/3 TaxID=1296344 RepID=A0A2T1C5E6_9CYAN|nr:NAD synthetase [Merismopedia glauca CCAP 1448/3]
METNTMMDSILGILALSILIGGLFMLFSGVRGMGNKP